MIEKKLFLLFVSTFVISSGIWAYNVGDYAYTLSGRYKIIGENLLENGDFSNGMTGWQTASGSALSADYFSVETATETSSGRCLQVLASGDEASLVNTNIMLEAATTYFISYKVKSSSGVSLTKLSGSNCQNFFINQDGSVSTSAEGYEAVASQQYYNDEWTEINVTVTPESLCFLVMNFASLNTGDSFADFGVYSALNVGDDRILQRAIDEAKIYYNMPELASGKEDFAAVINECEALVTESASDISDYVSGLQGVQSEFLESNGVDMSVYFKHFTFDDLTAKSNSTVSGWERGSRWGTSGADNYFLTIHADQYIGSGYDLGAGGLWQTQNLPAGKYLYSVSARGADWSNGISLDNYFDPVEGIYMFVNGDTIVFDDLPTRQPKVYTLITEVKEDGELTIGFGNLGVDNANEIEIDNNVLLLIGGNKEEVEQYVANNELESAKQALKEMIDSANTVYNYESCIFGKEDLKSVIDESEGVYNSSSDSDELSNQLNTITSAINTYLNLNSGILALVEMIEECEAVLDNEVYTKGKSTLQEAINTAKAFIEGLTEQNDDAIALATDELDTALNYFYVENASYYAPSNLKIQNPTFEEGPSSKGSDVPGWDAADLNQNSSSGWAQTTDESLGFDTGVGIRYGRNSTSHESKYLAQDVTLPFAGTYEFTAQLMAYHSKSSSNASPTGVYFFVGEAGSYMEPKIDSVGVFTAYTDGEIDPAGRYSLMISITEPTTVRFGVDAVNNLRATRICMSGCEVKYYGDYEQYLLDSIAAVVAPAKDTLLIEINIAKDLLENSRNKENATAGIEAFNTNIESAQVVYNEDVTTLDDLQKIKQAIADLQQAEQNYMISGVWPLENEYFDVTSQIQNNNMQNDVDGWLWIGTQPTIGEEGYMYEYFADGESDMNYSKVYQVLTGMPQGSYQFIVNATYRTDAQNNYPSDDEMNDQISKYDNNATFFIVVNSDSIEMKGLLQDVEVDNWSDIITSFNYRHSHPEGLLEGTRFMNYMEFDLTDTQTINLGISIVKPEDTYLFWAKNFTLLYWGDKVPTEISELTTESDNRQATTVLSCYNLAGQKILCKANNLKNLPKGIYIINGKKVSIH